MIFFIDSANLNEIRKVNDLGIISGVTTNPSLMAKEGVSGVNSILDHYKKICNIVSGDISAEVISTKFKDIIEEGHKLSEVDKKIVVKIPIIDEGLKAIHYFSKKKIKTNCTLVFSALIPFNTICWTIFLSLTSTIKTSPWISNLISEKKFVL